MNTVIKLSIQRMVCTGCGAEANASCNCGFLRGKKRSSGRAIKANPGKSDRAIAAELGIGNKTVSRARNSGVSYDTPGLIGDETPVERVGRDGKSYSIRQRVIDDPDVSLPRIGRNGMPTATPAPIPQAALYEKQTSKYFKIFQ
jgi:hypothetical protein